MPPFTTRRWVLALGLGALLFSVYLATMTGNFTSDDERYIVDTTDSIVNRGDLLLNQTVYLRGLQTTAVEPAQTFLAVPLYWLAYQTPWVGNIHAIFLFVPLVTALTGMVIVQFALDLGWRERTAVAAALLFGLTTIAWPYAQTYFREPLTGLMLLSAAFCLNRWRVFFEQHDRRAWGWLALGTGCAVVALFSKEAVLLAMPLLAVWALPKLPAFRRREFWLALGGVAIVFATAGVIIATHEAFLNTGTGRYEVLDRARGFIEGLRFVWLGLGGFFVTPGKSIWAFSPVTILALAGPFLLEGARWRETWPTLLTAVLFAVAYSAVRGVEWHGGLGWGPRYLVPLMPFLMVAALPALERMLFAESVWPLAGLGVLALAGLIVQVGGVLVDVRAYSDYLFAQTGQAPWQPLALWNPRWTQPVASLRLIGRTQTNILWLIGGVRWTALAGIGLLIAGWTAFLIWQRKPRPDRPSPLAVGIGIGVLVVATPLILSTAHDDPRFLGGRADLFEALDYLEAHTAANDVIMLTSETYLPFFQNHYKGSRDWYALPTSPGERFSCEQTPPVVSDDVNAQIHEVSRAMIDSAWGSDIIFGPTRGRLWLVGDISPYGPCQTRPVMHYAALNGGIIAVAEIAPNVRLVQTVPFSVVSRTDARPLNAAFGESIQLEAFTTRQSRGFLGLTLWWHAVDAPSTDYTVGVFLLGPAGVVQQIDWQPVFGFRPTSTWEDGDTIRDNYGFDLRDVPPGDYVIGVVLYELPSVERLPVTVGGEPQPDNLLVVTGVTVEP